MKGHQTRVMLRSARYLVFDPNRWWETRDWSRKLTVLSVPYALEAAGWDVSAMHICSVSLGIENERLRDRPAP